MKIIIYDVEHSMCRRNLMIFIDSIKLKFFNQDFYHTVRTPMTRVAHVVLKRRQ